MVEIILTDLEHFDETISDDDNIDNDNEINYFNSFIALTKKTFSENQKNFSLTK